MEAISMCVHVCNVLHQIQDSTGLTTFLACFQEPTLGTAYLVGQVHFCQLAIYLNEIHRN